MSKYSPDRTEILFFSACVGAEKIAVIAGTGDKWCSESYAPVFLLFLKQNSVKIHVDMNPIFFSSPAEFRKWLEQNYDQQKEVWVGFYKVKTGKNIMTWSEAVD
jgi:hypothetical protein